MRFLLLAAASLAAVAPLAAQTPTQPTPAAAGPTLSLDEAITLARRNNPAFLQSMNGRRRAGAALRSAYGAFLPSMSTGIGAGYREGRQQFFAGQAFGNTSDIISSDVQLSVFAQYSGATLNAPRAERANLAAAEADITRQEQLLRTAVVQQYFNALQSQARAALQDSLLVGTRQQLELARARVAVGAATILDVRRAEVSQGQQEVAALQARNQIEIDKLRLFQQMGVPQPSNAQLTSTFQVTEPTQSLEELLDLARRQNPALEALRAREKAAGLTLNSARSQYFPTLTLRANVSGFTNQYTNSDVLVTSALNRKQGGCEQENFVRQIVGQSVDPSRCSAISLTPAEIERARSGNSAFPFSFTRNPYDLSVSLSLPVFNGFTREQRVQEAAAARSDVQYNLRGQELALVADVTAAVLNVRADRAAVALQERNAQTAREALQLAQERYRVGATTFIELLQARADYERAQNDLINAVYQFHRDFAALENAVGRPLR